MTTTLHKSNHPSSSMSRLTGMESFNFKTVSILFILLFNAYCMSAQKMTVLNGPQKTSFSINSSALQIVNPASVPPLPKVYTAHIACNFPNIESASGQTLPTMDDSEMFNYDFLLADATVIKAKDLNTNFSKTTIKSSKNKLAPKLN